MSAAFFAAIEQTAYQQVQLLALLLLNDSSRILDLSFCDLEVLRG
jgi:hypothetical protein